MIIVTGGLGFIGSFICEKYRDNGYEVIAIDDMSGNVVDDIEGVKVHQNDAERFFNDYYMPDATLVVHCASPVGAVGVLSKGGSIAYDMARTTYKAAQYCLATETPLVNISTSEVYGRTGIYRESDDLRVPAKHSARLEYAAGKLAAEQIVFNSKGLRYVNIRPFNVAGPRQTSSKGFVIPTFIEQAIAGIPLTIFGTGEQKRAFTSVRDITDFIVDYAEELARNGSCTTFNVGARSNETTINELSKSVIAQIPGSTVVYTNGKIVWGDDYEEAEGFIKLPDATLAESTGWKPKDDISAIIEFTAEEYKCRS